MNILRLDPEQIEQLPEDKLFELPWVRDCFLTKKNLLDLYQEFGEVLDRDDKKVSRRLLEMVLWNTIHHLEQQEKLDLVWDATQNGLIVVPHKKN